MDENETAETNQETEVEAVENHEELDKELESYDEQESEEDQPDEVEEEDDSEEIDLNGGKLKVPKAIAEAKRSMDKDYTTKTQALAEERKSFARDVSFHQEILSEQAKVVALQDQIAQHEALDWNRLIDEDPVMAQKLQLQHSQLMAAKNKLEQELGGKIAARRQEATLKEQQETAKLLEESESVLRRDIKGWNADMEANLQQFAVKQFGFDAEDVKKSKADPRLYKLLHMANIGQQVISKQQQSKPAVVPKKAQPVTNLTGRGSKFEKSPDEMSDTEFAAWRRKQIANRGK